MNTLVAQTKTSHHAKPLRLVETKQMERDKWLAVRQSGIGGSDAAAAIGLNPYKSPLALLDGKNRPRGNVCHRLILRMIPSLFIGGLS